MKGKKRLLSALLSLGIIASALTGFAMQATVESKLYGDLNGDGNITTADSVLLNRYNAKWAVAEQIDPRAADVDGSSEVDVKDAVLLARHLAKWTLENSLIGQPIGKQHVDHPELPTDKASITLKVSAEMEKGSTQPLTFDFAAEKEPTNVVYTYRSSNGDIVDAAADGEAKGLLTAKAVGVSTVVVTAWMYDEETGETSNVSKSMDITVVDSGEKLTAGADYTIRAMTSNANSYADYLKQELSDRGTAMNLSSEVAAKEIVLSVGAIADEGLTMDGLQDSGYRVKVSGEKIFVAAKSEKGLDSAVRYLIKNYAAISGTISIAKTTDIVIGQGAAVKALTIAGNPIDQYELVIPDDYSPSIENAAKMLRRCIVLSTGLYLDVKTASEATEGKKQIRFVVDPTAKIAKTEDGKNQLTEKGYHVVESYGELKRAGYLIEVSDDGGVLITGGADAGNLYGAFEFGEEFVGMRFLDTDQYMYVADKTDIPAGLKHKEVPAFDYRYVGGPRSMGEIEDYYYAPRKLNATELQKVNNSNYGDAVGTMFWHAHSFYSLITEYFEQNDSSRGTLGKDIYENTQPCLTKEANYEEFIRKAEEEIQRRLKMGYVPGEPGMQQLTVAWNDNEEYHTCSGRGNSCTNVNREEGSISGTLVRFVNKVAEWLEDTHPEMTIFTIAYGTEARKPTVTALRDNVVLCYCWNGCNNHRFDGSACSSGGTGGDKRFQNKDDSKYFQKWSDQCSEIYAWYYSTNYYAYLAPLSTTYNIHYDFFWFAENGCDGIYAESQSASDFKGLEKAHSYLISNCLWNPYMSEENYQLLIEEYYRMTYGDGWRYLLEYMDMWIEAGDQLGCWLSNFSQPQEVLSVKYYAENYEKMRELFDKALAMANNSDQQRLIELASSHMEFLALCGQYEAQYENGTEEQKAAYTARYEAFYNILKKYNASVGDPSIPATAEITANPMKMYYNIDTIEPRWK